MKIMSILLVVLMLSGSVYAEDKLKMSSDPRLSVAYDSFEKGLKDEKRGDGAFRSRPGEAQRRYEHSEHYFQTAAFQYEELGRKHGIDVDKQIAECNSAYRRVHVKTGKARKRARR